jgi:hypothetical protein
LNSLSSNVIADLIAAIVLAVGVGIVRMYLQKLRSTIEELASRPAPNSAEIEETKNLCARAVVLAASADARTARLEDKVDLLFFARDNGANV